ncbi:hypothetical protein LCG56_29325 (plasmid) [Pseudomonas cannabina pv. alisalensis]|uniref:Uncharacterized protein n=1 Tax=Pseudomonas syringae pv. maculicola str. ES4326 TaxID=629265 RepID=A0A8T8C9W5_PSEYM|nr:MULTISPECIES: hypothetical protein [Pseudomonas syringae group]QHF00493.1 hypothetical protein PMA4326_028670 [Pseudomonas syringae pv. maculicola str. ES4326]UBZ00471.1 hypothetical protein LCG56_29325 [Pseudomonas cannabina pv. alisalensis]
MAIYEGMQAHLQEFVVLVKQAEQYTAAVACGAVKADQGTAQAHQQRVSYCRNKAQQRPQVSPRNRPRNNCND